jgi:hypothetical protein
MPNIDLSILNQRQTPAFYADTLANRPAAGFVGRIFVSTDTFAFYRDNGTTWDLIGGPGTGTVTGTGANGQVTYWNGASTITGSNDLFFDAVNGHLGIGTVTPGTALDVKHDQSTVVQLEQITATNDIRIAFINSGVGLWRLGAFYNAGANDFGLFDIAAATQPVTVKRTTGQVLIGTSTVGSGKLIVASTTSDNGIQIAGTTAPSLRIDNAVTGPSLRMGLGIATTTNDFIQNSAAGEVCIFSAGTTPQPITFGIYDTGIGFVVQAARLSAARNFLIGTTTDAGYKLDVSGTSRIIGNLLVEAPSQDNILSVIGQSGYEGALFISSAGSGKDANIVFGNTRNLEFHSTSSTTPVASGTTLMTLTNNGNLGIGIAPTTRLHVKGPASTYGQIESTAGNTCGLLTNNNSKTYFTGTYYNVTDAWEVADITAGGLTRIAISGSTGNLLINKTTDAGQKLQLSGTALISGNTTIGIATAATNLEFNLNGVSGKAQRIQFQNNGTNQWLLGAGAASETSAFELFNASGTIVISVDKTTNVTTINAPIAIGNVVSAAIAAPSTHKVAILINGVQYYLLASNV